MKRIKREKNTQNDITILVANTIYMHYACVSNGVDCNLTDFNSSLQISVFSTGLLSELKETLKCSPASSLCLLNVCLRLVYIALKRMRKRCHFDVMSRYLSKQKFEIYGGFPGGKMTISGHKNPTHATSQYDVSGCFIFKAVKIYENVRSRPAFTMCKHTLNA